MHCPDICPPLFFLKKITNLVFASSSFSSLHVLDGLVEHVPSTQLTTTLLLVALVTLFGTRSPLSRGALRMFSVVRCKRVFDSQCSRIEVLLLILIGRDDILFFIQPPLSAHFSGPQSGTPTTHMSLSGLRGFALAMQSTFAHQSCETTIQAKRSYPAGFSHRPPGPPQPSQCRLEAPQLGSSTRPEK